MSMRGYDVPLYHLKFETQVDWAASVWDVVGLMAKKKSDMKEHTQKLKAST